MIRLFALEVLGFVIVVMADLQKCAIGHGRIQLPRRSGQEVSGEALQRFKLFIADVRAHVLLEPEDKEPPTAFVRRKECSRSATLAPSRERNPLLDKTTAQISINQASDHFGHCTA
jgi:hypothetical protein